MRMIFALILTCVFATHVVAQESVTTEEDVTVEFTELTPENVWGFFEPNYRNGYQNPTCPDASVDKVLQEAFRKLASAGDSLESALKGASTVTKSMAADAVMVAQGEYEDLLAVCRYELRKVGRSYDLEQFQKSLRPLM